MSLHANLGVANNAGFILADHDAKAVVENILHAANKTDTVAVTTIHNQSMANNTSHVKWVVQLCPFSMVNPVPGTVFPTATIADLATSIAPFVNNDQVHRNLPGSPAFAQYFTANVSQLNSLTSTLSFFLVSTQNDSLPAHDAYAAQRQNAQDHGGKPRTSRDTK